MLDALIEPAFFGRVPERTILAERIARSLAQADGYEDVLDRARIFGQEQAFLIGVRVLAGTIGARAGGRGLRRRWPRSWSRRCSTRCGASSSGRTAGYAAARSRCSPWASSAGAK